DLLEEKQQLIKGHQHKVDNGFAGNLDIGGIMPQSAALAFRTNRLTPVTGKHDSILDLICLFFQFPKELVQSLEVFVSGPKQGLLFGRKIAIGPMYRKIKFQRIAHQLIQPSTHFFSAPRCYSSVIHRLALVRDNQIRVYTDDLSISFTTLACPKGIIETEKIG